jgi:hypothetical protein
MALPEDLDQHQVYLARVATNLLRAKLYPSYEEAYKAIRMILLDAETIGSNTKLSAVNKAIAKAIEASTTPAWDETTNELTSLAVYESSYYAQLIGGYAGVRMKTPPQRQVKDWMEKALMALESGKTKEVRFWPEYVSRNQSKLIDDVNNVVRAGYKSGRTLLLGVEKQSGESEARMLARARLSDAGQGKMNSGALIRTAVQFYANEGRRNMIEANKDLIAREVPFVTFDNRTSEICRSIDVHYAEGWPVDESPIGYPPFHINCRTQILPLVEGQEMPDGLRPAVGGKDTDAAKARFEAKEKRTGKKPKYKGKKDLDMFEIDRIKTSTRYDTWLRKQPRYFIEDVLGETRAKLFIEGRMSMASFSDLTLRQLTIKELAARDDAAFARAGIKP